MSEDKKGWSLSESCSKLGCAIPISTDQSLRDLLLQSRPETRQMVVITQPSSFAQALYASMSGPHRQEMTDHLRDDHAYPREKKTFLWFLTEVWYCLKFRETWRERRDRDERSHLRMAQSFEKFKKEWFAVASSQ